MESIRPADTDALPAVAPFPFRAPPRAPLPVPLSSLHGRESEIAAVVDLLQRSDVRLLTLTGSGGVGKTRLAAAAAAEVADTFPAGVCFVSLAPLADDRLVASVIARALGLPEASDQPLSERLRTWLQTRELMLLLDNFEHVIDAAPLIPDILAGCPGVKVLATSRAVLRVSGERSYAVSSLSEEAAVALFVDRAQAVNADFAATEANQVEISGICRRLDGLPLAIELAAALANALTPDAMIAQIERHGMLPAMGLRDHPSRQQSLHKTIRWSYDLLRPEEQTHFRCLSVFAGGFSIEMAESLMTKAGYPAFDVLEKVTSLVSQSLLKSAVGLGSPPRFDMLETIRDFGLLQLRDREEEDRVRHAHAVAVVALVERLLPGGIEPAPDGSLAQLQLDVDNLRAALSWLDDSGDASTCLRLARRLFVFWWLGGHLTEGRGWLERSLEAAQDSTPMRGEAICLLGLLQHYLGDEEAAVRSFEATLAMEPSRDDAWIKPLALRTLSEIATQSGHLVEAQRLGLESLTIFESIDPTQVPETLRQLGIVALRIGDLDRASELCEKALRLARETKDTQFIEWALDTLSLIACARGDYAGAVIALTEAFDQAESLGDLTGTPWLLEDTAVVAQRVGATQQSARLFGAAEAQRAALGIKFTMSGRPIYEQSMKSVRSVLGDVAFTASWDEGARLTDMQAVAEARAFLKSPMSQPSPHALRRRVLAGANNLTPREQEVLRLLIDGRSDRDIAEALFISPKTVGVHMTHILDKLGVASRAAAVAYAHRHDLA